MMGREPRQRQIQLTDIEVLAGAPVVSADSFYGKLGAWGPELIKDDQFADLYEPTGRVSVPPARLAKMLLLMYHDNVSEREAEERTKYDLRWKYALGLRIDEHVDRLALLRFRARLVTSKKARVAFERFIKVAVEVGLLKKDARQLVDSTHVTGAAAIEDTFKLIRHAIQKLLRLVGVRHGRKEAWASQLVRKDYEDDRKPAIDWKDEAARNQLLSELVRDARYLLSETEALELTEAEKELRDLLAAVTEQDIETDAEGNVRIRQGVARDRIPSTVDPQMRHGRKSGAGRFTGYKVTVTVEPESQFITNVKTHAGNSHDGSVLPEVIEQQQEMGLEPKEFVGDTAYGGAELRHALAQDGIAVVAPAPPEPEKVKKGRFTKSAFTIDLEQHACTCPAGHVTTDLRTNRHDERDQAFYFAESTCQVCPFRDQCLGKKERGRRVNLHRYEAELQKARAQQHSPEFKAAYRLRPRVERANAELKRHGLRKARYLGDEKLDFQALWTATVLNLKRLFKWLRKEPEASARLSAALAG